MTRMWCRLRAWSRRFGWPSPLACTTCSRACRSVRRTPGAKTVSVVGGMLAGADSIDDLDLLRHGGMVRLFGGVRAPSTLGTFLRSFSHGHVQQLDAVNAGLLAGLASRIPALLAGADAQGIAMLDVDDTVREVHGHAKQGAAFGYTRQRGLNV